MNPEPKQIFPTLLPLDGSNSELTELVDVARSDNHAVIAPTHVVRKHEDIVGYASIAGAVPVLTWLHSDKVKARDSLFLNQLAENLVRAQTSKTMIVPCSVASPFNDLMPSLGYQQSGETFKLWLK